MIVPCSDADITREDGPLINEVWLNTVPALVQESRNTGEYFRVPVADMVQVSNTMRMQSEVPSRKIVGASV